MSLRSLLRFWQRRPRARQRFLPTRRKPWVEVLEERTLLASGLGLSRNPGLDSVLASSGASSAPSQLLPPLTPAPFDPAAGTGKVTAASLSFATRLYLDFLHRIPQPAEAATWAAALDSGLSHEEAAGGFTLGDEYRSNLIQAHYRALLGRDAEAGAITGWLERLHTGQTEGELTALILGAPEFYRQQGGTPDDWLTGVYGVQFGRLPDPTGFAFWLSTLAAGAPREAVAFLIVSSPEGRAWTLQDVYQGLLRRDAEATGMAFWQAQLAQGRSLAQVLAGIAGSTEYGLSSARLDPAAAHFVTLTSLATPQGILSTQSTVSDTTLIVQGGGAPGQPIIVAVDGVALLRSRLSQRGGVALLLPQVLDPGHHEISVRLFDGSGVFTPSNSLGINVIGSPAAVSIRPPGLVGSNTPTLTVDVSPTRGMLGALTVAIDVDLNHDRDFEDPGERDFGQARVEPGPNAIPLDFLDKGGYVVRARLEDETGAESTSRDVLLAVNPKSPTAGGDPDGTGFGGGFGGQGGGSVSTTGGAPFRRLANGSSTSGTRTLTVGTTTNATHALGNQSEPAIAIDPTNPARLFLAANSNDIAPGVFGSYSINGGRTWTGRLLADGSDGLPAGFGDPSVSWDGFGNLFLSYFNDSFTGAVIVLSTDGGVTFKALAQIAVEDQPTITTGAGTVWLTARAVISATDSAVIAAGARVTGLGTVGSFSTSQIVPNSNMPVFGNFGDIAIGPDGQVLVTYQSSTVSPGPDQIMVSLDPDGLGPAGFSTPVVASNTNVGGFRVIPAQPTRTVGAEAGLAYDRSGGEHNGRVYLVYTDAVDTTTNDLNIFVRFSDDNGRTWSGAVRSNDDLTTNSQFFSKIALDQRTGNVAVSWYDARNDAGAGTGDTDLTANTDVLTFATASVDGGATFLPNVQVAQSPSNAVRNPNNMNEFGDYMGLAFFNGVFYPAWVDNSRGLATNPNATAFEVATASVVVEGTSIITPGTPGSSPIALPDDSFEQNDSSDRATNFGALSATQTFSGLSIGRHANGFPDVDWFRWTTSSAGTVSVTINYQPAAGSDLQVRVFTLNGQNSLVELGSSLSVGVRSQRVSVPVAAGQPFLVWIFGADFAQANYALTVALS